MTTKHDVVSEETTQPPAKRGTTRFSGRRITNWIGFGLSLALLAIALYHSASMLSAFWFTVILVISGFLLAWILSNQETVEVLRHIRASKDLDDEWSAVPTNLEDQLHKALDPVADKYGVELATTLNNGGIGIEVSRGERTWSVEEVGESTDPGPYSGAHWQITEFVGDGEMEDDSWCDLDDLDGVAEALDEWLNQR